MLSGILMNWKWSDVLYFSIETDLPLPDWHLGLDEFQIPVILVGLSAIIVTDSSKRNVFSSKGRIDQ
ncbi:MAG TPA: hypothetical protein GX009_08050 [Candidatus Atribacteria bacterium]|jgi:hypothetical protein|nr:hypothetical protein [Candidatus Atribacteria bacterium]